MGGPSEEAAVGFFDDVKAGVQGAVQSGQDKIDEVQNKKKADALLRDLGAWHYAVATGRDDGRSADELARIQGDLVALEAAVGPIDQVPPAPAPPPPPPPPPAPPAGAAPPPPPEGSAPPPPPPPSSAPPAGGGAF